ncbi:MAG: metallophosphoesterase [Candidatus Eisenbacteria sp.]|nr:metallophosphoesterase [Candidatus Eisenbacteria bacterium]
MHCFFSSDLHGSVARYRKLFALIEAERPEVVLLGGDLLPMAGDESWAETVGGEDFIHDFLAPEFKRLAVVLGDHAPRTLLILGNDDPRAFEAAFLEVARQGTWEYLHDRRLALGPVTFYGYSFVPPTPFPLKDWERYDVSRFVDPGAVPPEEGRRSVPESSRTIRHARIAEDLARLAGDEDLSAAVFLFHAPPYRTKLDRAALDGRSVDHVPLDVHVGSIAIRRFIEERQPRISLHGHVHEAARLTGSWRDEIGRTQLFTAAHDGPELAVVQFDASDPQQAVRGLY